MSRWQSSASLPGDKSPAVVRYPRSESDCTTWSFPHQINLTFGRRSRRLHRHPACGGQGSGRREPFSKTAFQATDCFGSSTWIRQDRYVLRITVLDAWKTALSSVRSNHGAFDHDSGAHIFPERNQQLSRQRHDRRLAPTTAVTFHSVLEPEGECQEQMSLRMFCIILLTFMFLN